MGLFDIFKKHKVTNENWEFYTTNEDDNSISFTTIDLTYNDPSERKGFKGELFIRIRIPNNKFHEGVIIPEEHEFQNKKEEELCNELIKFRIDCIQVCRLTLAGQKQYIFEYNDLAGFQKVFDMWRKTFEPEYEFELNLLEPFEYYTDLLPDKYIWQQIGNRHVIERLIDAGSNKEKEHFIEHGIFGKKVDLKMLYEEIKKKDIKLIGIEDDMMEVGIRSPIDLEDITSQTNYLIYMSEKYNCEYDGWNTQIEK